MSPRSLTLCVIVGTVVALVTYDVWVYGHEPTATITQVCRDLIVWHPLVPLVVGMFVMHLFER